MRICFFLLLSIFLFTACSMQETKIYSLSLSVEKKLYDNTSGVPLNIRVQSPRYLAQQYIAHRTSPYQLDISKYSRWELSPVEIVRDAFSDAFYSRGISKEIRTLNIVPAGYYAVEIKLRRFERIDSGNDSFGEVDFDVNVLSPEGKDIYRKTISRKVVLERKDNLNLAKSLSAALSEAVDEAMTGIGVIKRP
jgi:ABC-type uncharacterized transport system auxiliary subunit